MGMVLVSTTSNAFAGCPAAAVNQHQVAVLHQDRAGSPSPSPGVWAAPGPVRRKHRTGCRRVRTAASLLQHRSRRRSWIEVSNCLGRPPVTIGLAAVRSRLRMREPVTVISSTSSCATTTCAAPPLKMAEIVDAISVMRPRRRPTDERSRTCFVFKLAIPPKKNAVCCKTSAHHFECSLTNRSC